MVVILGEVEAKSPRSHTCETRKGSIAASVFPSELFEEQVKPCSASAGALKGGMYRVEGLQNSSTLHIIYAVVLKHLAQGPTF